MAVYLVTYDLKKPGQDYTDVLKEIRSHAWAKLSESSYAISTNSTVQQVYSALKPYLDPSDNLYVTTLKKPFTGFGPKEVNDWLEANLTY